MITSILNPSVFGERKIAFTGKSDVFIVTDRGKYKKNYAPCYAMDNPDQYPCSPFTLVLSREFRLTCIKLFYPTGCCILSSLQGYSTAGTFFFRIVSVFIFIFIFIFIFDLCQQPSGFYLLWYKRPFVNYL